MVKDFQVGGEPIHCIYVGEVQPLGGLVVQELKVAGGDAAEIVVQ